MQNDMGAVMRIRPGASQPEVFIGGSAKECRVWDRAVPHEDYRPA